MLLTSASGGSDWSTVTYRTLSQHCPGFAYYFARQGENFGVCSAQNQVTVTLQTRIPAQKTRSDNSSTVSFRITSPQKKTDYKYGATCDITAVNISEGGR